MASELNCRLLSSSSVAFYELNIRDQEIGWGYCNNKHNQKLRRLLLKIGRGILNQVKVERRRPVDNNSVLLKMVTSLSLQ